MRRFFLLISGILLAAGVLGMSMTYDGSYYLYASLTDGSPMVPNSREIHGLAERVPLLLSQFTRDPGLLQASFGVTYALITIAAVVAAWWVVKDRARHLFVWAALGILIAPLPGQLAFISDGAIVMQLAWTLWLVALLGVRPRDLLAIIPFTVLIFISHPTGFVLFGITAGLALFRRGVGWPTRLFWAGVWLVISAAAYLRFAAIATPYERQQLSLNVMFNEFFSSVFGYPLLSLICAWMIGLLLLRPRLVARWPVFGRLPDVSPRIPLVGLTLFLAVWAVVFPRWTNVLGWRFYVIPMSFPFLVYAVLDLWLPTVRPTPSPRKNWVIRLGAVFALTLGIQAVLLFGLIQQLRTTLADSPTACIDTEHPDAGWIYWTTFNHWGIASLSMILQGTQPEKIILIHTLCADAPLETGVPIASWDVRRWDTGWFDMSRLHANILAEN